ncbi:MAG: hypothetical protein M1469_07390 [Bacteroidetes bacterium]|nr:hypothetical protein [Bacteroidota bacterium]
MKRMMDVGLSVFLILIAAIAAQAQVFNGSLCPDNVSSGYRITGLHGDLMPEAGPYSFASRQSAFAVPEYSPVLMDATSLGAGAVGSFPLQGNLFLRISIINLYNPLASANGAVAYGSQGMLIPVELGLRVPFLKSELGSLGYTLYGESSAGLLFGWAFPTDGSFMNYSLPNSRFSSGASAYMGIGNSLRMDKYVGLYLNGGLGYYDFFSSSIMPQTNYLVPSVAVGFYFNFVP